MFIYAFTYSYVYLYLYWFSLHLNKIYWKNKCKTDKKNTNFNLPQRCKYTGVLAFMNDWELYTGVCSKEKNEHIRKLHRWVAVEASDPSKWRDWNRLARIPNSIATVSLLGTLASRRQDVITRDVSEGQFGKCRPGRQVRNMTVTWEMWKISESNNQH